MPQVNVTKLFDDYAKGARMTSYSPKGGKKRDGVYDVSDAVAGRMAAAGAIDGGKAKAPATTGGAAGSAAGGTGGDK